MLISSKIINGINGTIKIPGDKSISHRSIIIPSISKGITQISNLLWSEDVFRTINAFQSMAVNIQVNKDDVIIEGKGLNSLIKSDKDINLGNSGTSARLLTGLLSSQNFDSTLVGDKSLSKRPMARITKPLELMGAKFNNNYNKLPLIIYGKKLHKIDYELELPSAQVKSGLILAALNTEGRSKIVEKKITRNHTETMLESFEADIKINKIDTVNHIFINGKKELVPKNISVPSDLSSASFFIVAALINKNSLIKMNNINLNPTRDGILRALNLMQANIQINNKRTINGELIGDLEIKTSDLKGCELESDYAKLMIDEYPILSVAAAFAKSPSLFKGLGELKVKESNRLELIRHNLQNCGIFCKVSGEDLFIDPTKKISMKENQIKTNNDHRIAMSFAIMGMKLGVELKITDSEFIKTSFPNFLINLNSVGGNLSE
jgi:3-phosphoshikimate 1-carboxyvinyltransferase